jgi:spore maturation protein SpmB
MGAFFATFKRGALNGLAITYEMVKVIVPFYIAIEFLKRTTFLGFVSDIFRPAMSLFGLPGEAALGLMAGYFVNLYAAIAVLVPLNLPAREITVMALMLGIAHNLPLETAVTRQTGVNAWLMLLVRVLFSLLSGVILNLLWISFS